MDFIGSTTDWSSSVKWQEIQNNPPTAVINKTDLTGLPKCDTLARGCLRYDLHDAQRRASDETSLLRLLLSTGGDVASPLGALGCVGQCRTSKRRWSYRPTSAATERGCTYEGAVASSLESDDLKIGAWSGLEMKKKKGKKESQEVEHWKKPQSHRQTSSCMSLPRLGVVGSALHPQLPPSAGSIFRRRHTDRKAIRDAAASSNPNSRPRPARLCVCVCVCVCVSASADLAAHHGAASSAPKLSNPTFTKGANRLPTPIPMHRCSY